jgi:ataxia telangiectasia mutated family protein
VTARRAICDLRSALRNSALRSALFRLHMVCSHSHSPTYALTRPLLSPTSLAARPPARPPAVHIDFGVTFEQGKLLTTPETVPFRLTRDMVDGMGVTGTNGTFNRCCEVTMRVLRENAASILTILGVFMHDPLFNWQLSPTKRKALQQENDAAAEGRGNGGDESAAAPSVATGGRGRLQLSRTSTAASSRHTPASGTSAAASAADDDDSVAGAVDSKSGDASRVLDRLKQKLQGHGEDPNGDMMSVEGQVKLLVNEATDPENLCKIYSGWGAWL